MHTHTHTHLLYTSYTGWVFYPLVYVYSTSTKWNEKTVLYVVWNTKNIIIKMSTLVIRPMLSTVSSLPVVIYFSLYDHFDRSNNNNNNKITSSRGLYNMWAVNNPENLQSFVTLNVRTIYYYSLIPTVRCV